MKILFIILSFLLFISAVQAGSVDGRAILCKSSKQIDQDNPWRGYYFEKGQVFSLHIHGYDTIKIKLGNYSYSGGTKYIVWGRYRQTLDRKTLKLNDATCSLSSKVRIKNFLKQIITRAKIENKL
ncbi:MAG: hypothetical protein CMM37_13055 [Rhodospirillaceae bacterium]|nr:hypothetical protein [Rhodospirillaceae bacterium]